MKIAFNPSTVAALTTPPNNKDITFDLRGQNIFARGVKFCGTDTNTWRDIKINNVSIGSHTLDLRNGSNTTLTNTNGVVTINSTWRPVVDNLTSDSTTSSLSAKQGKVLKALIDGKSDSEHNHDGRYVRYYTVTTLDCNNLASGLTVARVNATNAANTHHSAYLYISDVGTPFQIQIPDFDTSFIYKRYYSSGKWSGWFKLNAGYADSAGSVAWANVTNKPATATRWPSWAEVTGKPSSFTPADHNHDNKYLRWLGNAGQSNMNAIGRISHSSGMTALSDPGNTIDNPMEGSAKSTSWHLYWQTNYTDTPSGSNAWVAQIVNRAGTDRWWVRSRSGGTITNGTGWTSNWRFLVTAPTSGLGNGNQPIYINSAGEVVAANSYPTSLKSPHSLTLKANGTTLAVYDGSSIKEANFTYANVGAASASHNHDERYVYNYGGIRMDGASVGKNALGMTTNSGVTGDWWHILQAAWNGEYRWNSQIAFPTQNRNGMYYRSGLDDDAKWGSWVKLLDTNNYSGVLDSRYYTESEVNSLLGAKLNRQNLSYGTWNPRGYNLAADYSYNGGDLSISENSGKIYVSIDGQFYQNEGQYRVLDTSDVAGLKGDLTVHQYLSNTDTTWWPLIWGGSSHANTSDSTGAVYKSHDKLSWQTSSQTLYTTHLRTTYIDLENNRGIFQVTSGGTSPYKGIRLPTLGADGIGMFSRFSNAADEGGIIISEDTSVIYNSFNTGWGLTVRDKDRGETNISGDGTIAFGVRQDYRAYSLGGFEKSGSNNSYVLLGGGGHKLESSLNVASATNAYHLRINSVNTWSTWYWAGQSGQPSWLWGSNDGTNMYVWNPSNFRVAYASSAGNADTVDGEHASNFVRAGNFESANLNSLDTYSFIKSVNSTFASASPGGYTGWYNVIQAVHRNGSGDGPGYIGQIALGMTTNIGRMFYRTKYNGSWYAWHEVVTTNTGLLRYSRNNVNMSSPNCSLIPPSLLEWTIGYPRLYDPEFNEGYNYVRVYNNKGNGVVTVTRVHDTNVGNSSSYIIKVVSAAGAYPNYGGWHVATQTELGKVYTCLFRARIPSGVEIEWNSNSIGTGGQMSWLTNNMGTDKWTWYAVQVYCGSGGSTTFYFSAKSPCTWYLSYVNVIENNRASYAGLKSVYSDYLKANASIVFGRNELQYFNQYTDVTAGATNNANPKKNWYHILRMNHANDSGYFVDLAIPFFDNRIQFRRITSGSDNGWRRVITEEPNHDVILREASTSGNVGIGINNPAYKLDVNGQMRAEGFHHWTVNSDNYMLLAGGGYKSFGGDDSNPVFLGYLNLDHGNDGTISSSFSCLGYSVPFTYTRGGSYCRIYIPDTTHQVFYIRAATASVHYSEGGMDTWTGVHRGSGAWWLHCYAYNANEVRVKGFCQNNRNNDSWWGGNPLWSGNDGANRITVCIFGYVKFR